MRQIPIVQRLGRGVILFLLFLSPHIFAEAHIFYTQPENNALANLTVLTGGRSGNQRIIPLVGRYEVLDGGSGQSLGRLNVPCIFRDSKTIILRKKFPRQPDPKATYTFHFAGLNGTINIRINDRVFFKGSQNFLPLEFDCPAHLLCERENLLEIEISPWRGDQNEFPQWLPVNLPVIYSGVTAPVFLKVRPFAGVQKLSAICETKNDSAIIRARVHFQPDESYPLRPLSRITLWKNQQKVLEKRLFMEVDSARGLGEFDFTLAVEHGLQWSAAHPDQWRLQFQILRGNEVLSGEEIPVFSRRPAREGRRLLMDGKPIDILGMNYVYQDSAGVVLARFPTIMRDLKNIKQAGFNAIRLPYFPANEIVYAAADSLGLYCFQDLPFALSALASVSDSLQFYDQMKYLNAFLRMADRHPSLVGVGFDGDHLHASGAAAAWTAVKNIADRHRDYWLYARAHHYGNLSGSPADFVLLDLPERNGQSEELAKISRALDPNGALMVSALSKPISYRVDSTAIVHDLKQIHELYIRFNRPRWRKTLAGQFLFTYADFMLNTPSLQAGPQHNFTLHATGLYSPDRRLKTESRSVLNKKYVEAIDGGIESEKSSASTYIFTITGLINFLFFLVFYRSSIEFRQNIKRSIKKPYGFFSDLQERRLIPLTENFFLLLFLAVNGGVMTGSLLYFFRNNFYMDYLISLVFYAPAAKKFIIGLIWQPVFLVPFLAALIILFVLGLAIPIRLSALFRAPIIRSRQAIAVSAWAGSPFVLLLPFGMFFYSLLLVLNSYWILIAVLLYFHAWYFLRWTNGTRVLSELTYARMLLFNLIILLVMSGGGYFYWNHEIQIGKHLVYLFRLFRALN